MHTISHFRPSTCIIGGFEQASVDLLLTLFPLDRSIRLLGLSLSALTTDDELESRQLSFEL